MLESRGYKEEGKKEGRRERGRRERGTAGFLQLSKHLGLSGCKGPSDIYLEVKGSPTATNSF